MAESAGLQDLRDRVTLTEAGLKSLKEETEMITEATNQRTASLETGLTDKLRELWSRVNADTKENRDANQLLLEKQQKANAEIVKTQSEAIAKINKARTDDTRHQLNWIKGIAGSVLAAIITGALIAFLK